MTAHPSSAHPSTDDSRTTLEQARAAFFRAYPDFETTRLLDELRATDYERLDRLGHIYLDYTGGSLYGESQLRQHMDLLGNNVFGNPHSVNPTSAAATHLTEETRAAILDYFNASPDEYVVIFTPNASGALKLVGESYPFTPRSRYVLTFDNHNSVNGIREFARAKGAAVDYVPIMPPDLRLNQERLLGFLEQADPGADNLFAYPAQSNFSGVQHPLEFIPMAQERGWDVLADCAAFVPTNRLDLSRWRPDFVSISFYKIFGYPTGIGCLLARRTSLEKLRRPWFAGGTITMASVQGDGYCLAEGEAAFEDGTIDYLNIPAVKIGLDHMRRIGIDTLHRRVHDLTAWLLDGLLALRHSNGMPLARVYGPTDTQARGGTVSFNFYDPDGELVDYRRVEVLASQANISLRTGCFCNPGAGEIAHGLTAEEMAEAFKDEHRMTLDQFLAVVLRKHGKSAGAIRVSLGIATNFADVHRFLEFAAGFVDRRAREI